MLSIFSIRYFNILLIIVVLNSLSNISNTCVISESNFNDCFVSSDWVFLAFILCLVSFLLQAGHDVWDSRYEGKSFNAWL